MPLAISIIHILVCVFLILIVLLQTSKGADIGAAFGGGSSQTLFGSAGPGGFFNQNHHRSGHHLHDHFHRAGLYLQPSDRGFDHERNAAEENGPGASAHAGRKRDADRSSSAGASTTAG